MEDNLHYLAKWKTTPTSQANEDNLNYLGKWKTISFLQANGRQNQLFKFGQFDWDVSILDKRNDTVIEDPYHFITELGNMVEPELANEDLELEDISYLTYEIHLNEQEFDDV